MFATNRPLHLLIVLATVVLHASSSADNHQPSSQRRPNRGLVRFADNQHQPAPVAVQSRTTATVAIKPKSSASPTKTKKPSVPARFESKKKPPVNNKPSAAVAAISSKSELNTYIYISSCHGSLHQPQLSPHAVFRLPIFRTNITATVVTRASELKTFHFFVSRIISTIRRVSSGSISSILRTFITEGVLVDVFY